ncbi:sensor histidine kinase [Porphyromonas loveana]|uniref:sensor histidine kinase n=1 Tax=Porphyromonas loveana TaxID=1884669 RepID=UPI0035A09091
MKLSTRIILRLSAVFLTVFTVWVVAFYFVIVDEIHDETNDSLENYSEHIIRNFLSDNPLPTPESDLNNTYSIRKITLREALEFGADKYYDEMVYVKARRELEPCRTMRTVFSDGNGSFYELKVSIPTFEKTDLQGTLLQSVVYLFMLLLAVTIGVTTWIVSRSFRSLYKLLDWLSHFRVDKPLNELTLGKTDIVEFRRLNEVMQHTARHNVEVFERQREFISHASHELQTPLTISRNKLELLLQDPHLSEQQLELVYKAIQSINHIVQLNKTLLLFSKIENRQFTEIESISISDLLHTLVEEYDTVFADRAVTVVWQEKGPMTLEMNPTLAKVLLSNLLKNAYVHNITHGGRISISLSAEVCAIANTGKDTPLDEGVIFERFYHDFSQEHSSGLGLSIARSICQTYSLDLSYTFDEGLHLFSIRKQG